MKKVCIIIPIYHIEPTRQEIVSIQTSMEKLGTHDVFFIAPANVDVAYYRDKFPNVQIRKYTKWTNDIDSYSRLLISPAFYKEYMHNENKHRQGSAHTRHGNRQYRSLPCAETI